MDIAPEPRSERIDLRITPAAKQMLQRAAHARNKSLTEFLLDSGLHAAHGALLDRQVFMLDPTQWDAFSRALDTPPQENPGLRALLARKPAWEA